jgi:outer membrane protein
LENNGFLSRERAEQAQQKLAKKEQELQQLEAKLTQDIMIENQKLTQQLADSVINFLQEYNADGRYHMILSNNAKDNVLMAAEQYDITEEVISAMNARCKK